MLIIYNIFHDQDWTTLIEINTVYICPHDTFTCQDVKADVTCDIDTYHVNVIQMSSIAKKYHIQIYKMSKLQYQMCLFLRGHNIEIDKYKLLFRISKMVPVAEAVLISHRCNGAQVSLSMLVLSIIKS